MTPIFFPAGPIGLGCVTFGREIDAAASFALLDHARERGVRLLDTAAAYGNGASEHIVGDWLGDRKPAAGSVTVVTKILPPYTPGRIETEVEACRLRLRAEHLDVLLLHRWDPAIEDPAVLVMLDRLVRDGRVGAIGLSNVTADQLARALKPQIERGLTPFRMVQNNHNLAVRDVDDALRTCCVRHGIAVVTYSPLAAGFLTGKHQHGAAPGTRFDIIPGHQAVYFHATAYRRLERLQAVAARTGLSPVHLALAWALHQSGVSTVLVGGRTPAHLDQAFSALALSDPALFEKLSGE